MPIAVDIQVDQKQLERAQNTLKDVRGAFPRVMRNSINATGRSVRTRIIRAVSTELGLPQKRLRRDVSLYPATRTRWSAMIRCAGRRTKIIRLDAKQTSTGVSYKAAGGRKFIPHAFIATMPAGHTGVFLRRGSKRLPIDEQYLPAVRELLETMPGIMKDAESAASAMLKRRIENQVAWEIEKASRS